LLVLLSIAVNVPLRGDSMSAAWVPPTGPIGPIAAGANSVKIGDNNVEYSFWPARTRIKAVTTVTFTNVGDIPHDATSLKQGEWTTGALARGESKTVTFSKPGLHYYISAPRTPGCMVGRIAPPRIQVRDGGSPPILAPPRLTTI
jgi:plastocyanin